MTTFSMIFHKLIVKLNVKMKVQDKLTNLIESQVITI